MIAFTAHTHAQTSVPDGQEIAETIWVSQEEFQEAALAAGCGSRHGSRWPTA